MRKNVKPDARVSTVPIRHMVQLGEQMRKIALRLPLPGLPGRSDDSHRQKQTSLDHPQVIDAHEMSNFRDMRFAYVFGITAKQRDAWDAFAHDRSPRRYNAFHCVSIDPDRSFGNWCSRQFLAAVCSENWYSSYALRHVFLNSIPMPFA